MRSHLPATRPVLASAGRANLLPAPRSSTQSSSASESMCRRRSRRCDRRSRTRVWRRCRDRLRRLRRGGRLRSLWLRGVELASHRLTTLTKRLLLTAVQREEKGTAVSHSKRDALLCRNVDDLTCGKRPTTIGSAIDRRSHPDFANGFSRRATDLRHQQTALVASLPCRRGQAVVLEVRPQRAQSVSRLLMRLQVRSLQSFDWTATRT